MKARYKIKPEEGFTIIEIMVVTFIIGVLTAISVPVFHAQKKSAVKITVVADVRNAASEMEKAETFSENGYGSSLPDAFIATKMNTIEVIKEQSSKDYYCLRGTTANYNDIFIYYNSTTRRLVTDGTSDSRQCGVTGSLNGGTTTDPKNPGGVAGEFVTSSPTPTPSPTASSVPIPNVTSVPVPSAPVTSSVPDPSTPSPVPTSTNPGGVSPETVATPPGYNDPNRTKYDICHNGNMLTLPLSGILSGHSSHPEDIIPPIPGAFFPGLNWDKAGSEIWFAGCDTTSDTDIIVPSPSPSPSSAPPNPTKIPAPPGYNDPKAKKFAICHNGNMISPAISGIVHGHDGHTDDIIPPIPGYVPNGMNWDATGSAIWYAGCAGQK